MALADPSKESLDRRVHGSSVGLYQDLEMQLMEEVEHHRTHWAHLDRGNLHSGKEELAVVEAQVEASDVAGLADLAVVLAEAQGLARPVPLVQPLYRRRDCLGRDRWTEVLDH